MLRYLLAALFVLAGLNHFRDPNFYLPMMPPYLPEHAKLIALSGLFEILGGLGLLVPLTRKFAGFGLILLLILVFPANLHMALNNIPLNGVPVSPWILWIRLPFQAVFIVWVWWVAIRIPPARAPRQDAPA